MTFESTGTFASQSAARVLGQNWASGQVGRWAGLSPRGFRSSLAEIRQVSAKNWRFWDREARLALLNRERYL